MTSTVSHDKAHNGIPQSAQPPAFPRTRAEAKARRAEWVRLIGQRRQQLAQQLAEFQRCGQGLARLRDELGLIDGIISGEIEPDELDDPAALPPPYAQGSGGPWPLAGYGSRWGLTEAGRAAIRP